MLAGCTVDLLLSRQSMRALRFLVQWADVELDGWDSWSSRVALPPRATASCTNHIDSFVGVHVRQVLYIYISVYISGRGCMRHRPGLVLHAAGFAYPDETFGKAMGKCQQRVQFLIHLLAVVRALEKQKTGDLWFNIISNVVLVRFFALIT